MKHQPIIEMRNIEDLIPYARNSRTHDDAQVAQIAASIKEFGFTNPILVDGEGGIIAGHGRVLAARKLQMNTAPCITLGHLSDAQRRAYIIADNKLALNSAWDSDLLSLELGDLRDGGFNMALLGFDAQGLTTSMGLDEELDGKAPKIDGGIEYQEKFAIIVDCDGEADQQASFERLSSMGFTCKVLVN